MNPKMGRRTFVRMAGTAGAVLASGGWELAHGQQGTTPRAPGPDAGERELVLLALDAVKSAGAAYADVRITRRDWESVNTRERQITSVNNNESYGIGVRALVGGSWGFAATQDLSEAAVVRAAREAAAVAAANDRINPVETVLAPVEVVADGRWITPYEIDPLAVSIEEKAELLFRTNEEALKVDGVRFVTSGVSSVRESRLLGTTDGSMIQQTFFRLLPYVNVTAVSSDNSDFQNRDAALSPMGSGWEYIVDLQLPENALRWAEEAARKLTAPSVEPGEWDLVLDPSHLWLTLHESIGHPTELDRAVGYEANYAGTSFLSPPEDVLNKFQYGPEFMNVVGNRTRTGWVRHLRMG